MTSDNTLFKDLYPCHEKWVVKITDDSCVDVVSLGTIIIFDDIVLTNVLYVPKLTCNLLSVGELNLCLFH